MHRNLQRRLLSRKQTFADLFPQRYPKAGRMFMRSFLIPPKWARYLARMISRHGARCIVLLKRLKNLTFKVSFSATLSMLSPGTMVGCLSLRSRRRAGKTTEKCSSTSTVVPTPCILLAPPWVVVVRLPRILVCV